MENHNARDSVRDRLAIEDADIVSYRVDAAVNASNPSHPGGGGVDGAIYRAAGPLLHEACRPLSGCVPGKAKMTPGFRLPARYVIHTVGPICAALWSAGVIGEETAPPRDAAEIVREGDVSQWLEHYRRERAQEWEKQRSGNPPPETQSAPEPADNAAGATPKR